MPKLTITKLYINDKGKDGKPFMGKNGPYSKIAIKTQEYGPDKYVTGFVGAWNANWRVGDVVDCDIEENGDFLNMKRPDPLAALEKRVKLLELAVFVSAAATKVSGKTAIKTALSEDSPF